MAVTSDFGCRTRNALFAPRPHSQPGAEGHDLVVEVIARVVRDAGMIKRSLEGSDRLAGTVAVVTISVPT